MKKQREQVKKIRVVEAKQLANVKGGALNSDAQAEVMNNP